LHGCRVPGAQFPVRPDQAMTCTVISFVNGIFLPPRKSLSRPPPFNTGRPYKMKRREIALDVACLHQVCAFTDIFLYPILLSLSASARHSFHSKYIAFIKNLSAESVRAAAVTVLSLFTPSTGRRRPSTSAELVLPRTWYVRPYL